jgi:hypothetical protein
MIVEMGFHTNPVDCDFFKNNHRKLATVQARAISPHYGLKKKAIRETEEHWVKVHYNNLIKKGIEIQEKRFDDKMSRGEAFALLNKLTDKIETGG